MAVLAGTSARADIRVVSFDRVSIKSAGGGLVDETLRVTARNNGAAATQVSATVTSYDPKISVAAGNLTFPDVAAGATMQSTNTFVMRRPRFPLKYSGNLVRVDFTAFTTPVANAGPDQYTSGVAFLTAVRSYDPFGKPLTYAWSTVSAPDGSHTEPDFPTSSVTKAYPDHWGDYEFELVVSNGVFTSAPSRVKVSVTAVNPVANAGPDQTAAVKKVVQLDGSRSTHDMEIPLTYSWQLTSVPGGSRAVLSNPNGVRPTFKTDKKGTYVAQLTVSDGTRTSAPDTVTISTSNTPPQAEAGAETPANWRKLGTTFPRTAAGLEVVQLFQRQETVLSGHRSSDSDGDFLTFRWFVLSKPAGSLVELSGVSSDPAFVPDVNGNYHLQLNVSDGHSETTSTVLYRVAGMIVSPEGVPQYNDWMDAPPMPNEFVSYAGPNPSAVTFSAHGSRDFTGGGALAYGPDGWGAGGYSWSLLSKPVGSAAALSSGDWVESSLTPDVAGDYVAQLRIPDSYKSQLLAAAFSTSWPLPEANAGLTQYIDWQAPMVMTLDGTGSRDQHGLPLSYQWTLLNRPPGSSAALSNATSATPSFTADVDGSYVFQLVVSNGQAKSLPSTTAVVHKVNEKPFARDLSITHAWQSPCIPVTFAGEDAEMADPYSFERQGSPNWSPYSGWDISQLPAYGFLWVGVPIDQQRGNPAKPASLASATSEAANSGYNRPGVFYTLCYTPFSSTFVGVDSFEYTVRDRGFPDDCGEPTGFTCLAPATSDPGTGSIQIFQTAKTPSP